MSKRLLVGVFTVMFLVSSVAIGAGTVMAAGPLEIRCTVHFPPPPKPPKVPGATWLAMTNFADRVEKGTDGRVVIKMFWGAQLGKPIEQVQMVSRPGVADAACISAVYHKWELPLTVGCLLPFLTSNMRAMHAGFWELYNNWAPFKAEFDSYNIMPLYMTPSPPYTIGTKDKVIRTLDDLKGLKIFGTGYFADVMKAVGVQVITTAANEIYDMLAKGTLDGAFFPHDGHKFFGYWTMLKAVLNVDFVGGKSEQIWIINKDVWNKISKADRKAMKDAAATIFPEFIETYKGENLKLNEEFTAKGIIHTSLSAADQEKWKKIGGETVRNDWLNRMDKRKQGDVARELLKRYTAIVDKYPGSEFVWPKK